MRKIKGVCITKQGGYLPEQQDTTLSALVNHIHRLIFNAGNINSVLSPTQQTQFTNASAYLSRERRRERTLANINVARNHIYNLQNILSSIPAGTEETKGGMISESEHPDFYSMSHRELTNYIRSVLSAFSEQPPQQVQEYAALIPAQWENSIAWAQRYFSEGASASTYFLALKAQSMFSVWRYYRRVYRPSGVA